MNEKDLYIITVSPFEVEREADIQFLFTDKHEAYTFMELCFKNQHDVKVRKTKVGRD